METKLVRRKVNQNRVDWIQKPVLPVHPGKDKLGSVHVAGATIGYKSDYISVSCWFDVTKVLPPENIPLLLWRPGYRYACCAGERRGIEFWFENHKGRYHNRTKVTHWAYAPAGPIK